MSTGLEPYVYDSAMHAEPNIHHGHGGPTHEPESASLGIQIFFNFRSSI